MNKQTATSCLLLFLVTMAYAADWSTYRGNYRRSGVSDDNLVLPLKQSWMHKSAHSPSPAWPPPAEQDFWHRIGDLQPTMDFDTVYHPVVANGRLYYGSSADDTVYCIDTETGNQLWSFITEGPIRLAPSIANEKLYAGSDDGNLYCLDALTGKLVWKYAAGPMDKRLPGNGRMISLWPVRCGVVVKDDTVYFTAGLFPSRGGVYLCAVNANNGKEIWKKKLRTSAQGYLVASEKFLYVSTGRTPAVVFRRSDGKRVDKSEGGGSFGMLANNIWLHSRGEKSSQILFSDPATGSKFGALSGDTLVADKTMAYILNKNTISALDYNEYATLMRQIAALQAEHNKIKRELVALDKKIENDKDAESEKGKLKLEEELQENKLRITELKKKSRSCRKWRIKCPETFVLAKAGNIVFAGGADKITALSASEGKALWSAKISGKARGIAIAKGKLFVSTDTGNIYCFGNDGNGAKTTSAASIAQPYPKNELTKLYGELATTALNSVKEKKGYCLVLGSGDGRLAYEIAKRSEFKVIGVESNALKAANSRKLLSKTGLYGKRVVIHQHELDKLPYPQYFANLVVDARLPPSPKEAFRMLRPCGGAIVIAIRNKLEDKKRLANWGASSGPEWKIAAGKSKSPIAIAIAQRGKLEGAGEWTHLYANPGNTACSNDKIVKGPLDLQWFGRPGPRDMIDRHHRNMVPLYKDGRLFVPGDCIIFALDAYNGTIQWERKIPGSRRLGIFLDAGNMTVDDDRLYMAVKDKCLSFDTLTGEPDLTYSMPDMVSENTHKWSCLMQSGKVLLGSACRKNAPHTKTSRQADAALWHLNMKVVTSDLLFGLDKTSGKTLWTYKDGIIANPTITVGDGRVYFIETTSPKAVSNKLGRMPVQTLSDAGEQFLVALNWKNGALVYKKKLDMRNYQQPIFLNYANGIVLLSGSRAKNKGLLYSYNAFEASTGKESWQAEHLAYQGKANGGHGEQNRHPTIVGDSVYAWPYAYNLQTGQRIETWKMNRKGHGCGGVSASAKGLFWRGRNPWMRDLKSDNSFTRLTSATRPGCWINIIPAGGLILIPEASSGCTCPYSLQTSMALAPSETESLSWRDPDQD